MSRAQLLHQRLALGRHLSGAHVRQAVDHIRGSVFGTEQLTHRRIHLAIAGEAQVHDRHVQATTQDRGMHHARA